MKKHYLFIVLISLIQQLHAECAYGGLQVFPTQKEISLNPMFIIQGYDTSEATINSFRERQVYLVSESGALVTLQLHEILKGEMYISQAIFCLTTPLLPNTQYSLSIENQTKTEYRELLQYNQDTQRMEKVRWRTTTIRNTPRLSPYLRLSYVHTEVKPYGCGPEANAVFDIIHRGNTEVWFRTEVVDLSTNCMTTFYLKGWGGKLFVGHGMCSGAFRYRGKGNYKVRFTPVNIDGKPLPTTQWTTFENPYQNHIDPFG